jgi:DNA-directed RNA polymerase subunit D
MMGLGKKEEKEVGGYKLKNYKMELEFREFSDNGMRFLISNVSPYFVNSIRRTLLAEIPKLAIEDVIIYDNTSALFDEIISHRLGMIPLPTYPGLLVFKDECKCVGKGCPNCTVHYTLSKEGPCTVYSKDLIAEDKMWKVVDGGIPIVRLLKGQRLILEAEACLGTAEEHAKWQVANGVGYKYYPEISINERCDNCGKCIDICPKKILIAKNNKVAIDKDKIEECIMCNSCVDVCEKNAIKVKKNPNKFLFQFETDGSMTAKDALIQSLAIIRKKYEDFGKMIGKL